MPSRTSGMGSCRLTNNRSKTVYTGSRISEFDSSLVLPVVPICQQQSGSGNYRVDQLLDRIDGYVANAVTKIAETVRR